MNPYLFLAAAAQTETHPDRIQFHHHFVARSESDRSGHWQKLIFPDSHSQNRPFYLPAQTYR